MDSFWGVDVPTWLAAVGTIGAFASGGALLLRELRRDRDRELFQERAQASSVAAWPAREEQVAANLTTIHTKLQLNNASKEPVYRVGINYCDAEGNEVASDIVDILAPGLLQRELPRRLRETWVKSQTGWIKRQSPAAESTKDPFGQPWEFTVVLSFTDAAGRRWRRNRDGSLWRDNGAK